MERRGPGSERGAVAALTMFSPLAAIVREPLTIPLETPVRAALELMERTRSGLVVVADPARRLPLGIFTLRDAVRRVTLPGGELGQPIAAVMTSGLITLPPQATAHQAALTMAHAGVSHLVVVDGEGRLEGVVSRDDLFGLQRTGVTEVGDELQAARDLEALRGAAQGIRKLADGFLARGVGVETLTHYISTLNDLLTIRVIELTADEVALPPVPMCWIALGSEGRLEQTFATDQDNGLIFDADEADADRLREAILPFARKVNERLDACGFPLCRGGVMASNPRWCLTLEAWQRAFSRWLDVPEPEALLNATIFFDLRPIHGDAALAERLRAWLLGEAAGRSLFLRHLAQDALRSRPPLGLVRDFVFDRSAEPPRTLDLKAQGSRVFVDAARVLALAHGVPHTSTAERLRGAAEAARVDPARVAAAVDGFHFVHLLRLRSQRGLLGARSAGNRVDPRELDDVERHLLKEALRQARVLQTRLALDYHLGA